ncbi:ABC transporter ATP-binding protein [Psychromarinibacter sp. S121]|uniref:ABC transporter ATP-binding protein n=1 Tax=Psychromarinibacter sp. S121 TaxID=3415127 RepID=UPI003C7C7873
MTAPLLTANGLVKEFGKASRLTGRRPVRAVAGVDLEIRRGEAVGLVGESGSGKSTIGRMLLGLIPPTRGEVKFDGAFVAQSKGAVQKDLRRRMQLIFQDPYSSLDPRRRIGAQIADGMKVHGTVAASEIPARVDALLEQVGLGPEAAGRYPHEFSGGQRQRLSIARALSTGPEFIVADEPVSALDVSIQAQIVRLLHDLGRDLDLSLLFISHDLAVVHSLCDRVVVLYLGRVMEEGPAAEVFARPQHPYTRALISCAPSFDPERRKARMLLKGDPPSPANPPSGCVFRTRCPHAIEACAKVPPPLAQRGNAHRAACIRPEVMDTPFPAAFAE